MAPEDLTEGMNRHSAYRAFPACRVHVKALARIQVILLCDISLWKLLSTPGPYHTRLASPLWRFLRPFPLSPPAEKKTTSYQKAPIPICSPRDNLYPGSGAGKLGQPVAL